MVILASEDNILSTAIQFGKEIATSDRRTYQGLKMGVNRQIIIELEKNIPFLQNRSKL